MKKNKGLKVLIFGMDGATFEIIDPLLQQGQLPNLRSLMEGGVRGKLRSTIPNMSAPAWGAFMTGKNPGKLGVYDFYTYDPTKYSFLEPSLITSAPMVGQTFWDILGKLDYRVGIITVPVTYPPWEVNGFMISGYPCPDSKNNHSYPPDLADSLLPVCNLPADTPRTFSREQMAEAGYQMMATRTEVALNLLAEHPCDLLCLVLGATDMAQHYFWKHSAIPLIQNEIGGQFSEVIPKMYQKADECLGKLLQLITEDTLVFILSDHGGGPVPVKEVNTNVWLEELGLLRSASGRNLSSSVLRVGLQLFKRTVRRRAKLTTLLPKAMRSRVREVSFNVTAIDWAATKVYRFPMSPPAEGLVINVSGRQTQGIVSPGDEYERLRESLMDQVIQLKDPETGQPMVERVFKREELYNGEFMDRAPDLVVLFREGYMGGKGLQPPLLAPHPVGKLSGHHSSDGILLVHGPEIKKDHRIDGAHILDLAPTILYALNVPIPKDMDGRVLQDIFQESFLQDRPIAYSEPLGTSHQRGKELTSEEEENIREKLRSLGYLE